LAAPDVGGGCLANDYAKLYLRIIYANWMMGAVLKLCLIAKQIAKRGQRQQRAIGENFSALVDAMLRVLARLDVNDTMRMPDLIF
jgi:CRISPR/Cas system CSM-associated protein Csm2 small subunit